MNHLVRVIPAKAGIFSLPFSVVETQDTGLRRYDGGQ